MNKPKLTIGTRFLHSFNGERNVPIVKIVEVKSINENFICAKTLAVARLSTIPKDIYEVDMNKYSYYETIDKSELAKSFVF